MVPLRRYSRTAFQQAGDSCSLPTHVWPLPLALVPFGKPIRHVTIDLPEVPGRVADSEVRAQPFGMELTSWTCSPIARTRADGRPSTSLIFSHTAFLALTLGHLFEYQRPASAWTLSSGGSRGVDDSCRPAHGGPHRQPGPLPPGTP